MPRDAYRYPTQLMKMFPTVDGDVVVAILEQVNNDFNAAVQALIQLTEDQDQLKITTVTSTQEQITPAILVELTSTPIDQLLQDEMFAQALQRTLNEEASQPSRSSRPSSKSSQRSTMSALKSKWSSISDKTKQKVQILYSKLKGKQPSTPLRGNFMFDDDNDKNDQVDEQRVQKQVIEKEQRLEQIKSIYPKVDTESSAPSVFTIQRQEQRRSQWPEDQPRQMPLEPTLIMNDNIFQDAELRAKSKSPEKPLIDFDDF